MKTYLIIPLFLFSLLPYSLKAQESLAELAEMTQTEAGLKKLAKQGLYQHNYITNKWPKAYKIQDAHQHQRLGILTLMVVDKTPGDDGLAEGGMMQMATQLDTAVVQTLQAAAKSQGVDLLVPSQYLTNQELLDQYLQMDLDPLMANQSYTLGAAIRYMDFPELADFSKQYEGTLVKRASFQQIGRLAQACELDGFVVIAISAHAIKTNSVQVKLLFENLTMTTILTNQTAEVAGEKYPRILGGYLSGVTIGYSILARGGLPLMEFVNTVTDVEYVTLSKRIITTKLKPTKSYIPDLAQALKGFAEPTFGALVYNIQELNKSNKF